jgi:hypothetical protein
MKYFDYDPELNGIVDYNTENFWYELDKKTCRYIIKNAHSKYLQYLQNYNLDDEDNYIENKYKIIFEINEEIHNYYSLWMKIDFDEEISKSFLINLECKKYLNLKLNEKDNHIYLCRAVIESKKILHSKINIDQFM